jgi:hypothetical protein
LPKDLLEQATTLATIDLKGRPKQVNLRRSVSAAYYSLFHFLVDNSCRAIMGGQNEQRGYRSILARAFVHGIMYKACTSYSSGQLPKSVLKPLPKTASNRYFIAKPIQEIARLFRELQQKRHLADYDRSERFQRSEILTQIDEVKRVISSFENLFLTDERHFFLVSLLAWKEMSNRE